MTDELAEELAINTTAKQVEQLPVILESSRLHLRPGQHEDLPALQELFADPQVMRFSLSGPLASVQIPDVWEKLWGESRNIRIRIWCLEQRETGVWMGIFGLLADPHSFGCELTYRLLPRFWNAGYATEAGRAILDAVRIVGLSSIVAYIEPANVASCRVACKLGLRDAGEDLYRGLAVRKYVASGSDPSPSNTDLS